MIATLILTLFTNTAHAFKFYMAGYGPSVNTMLYPFAYPADSPVGSNTDGQDLNKVGRDLGLGGQYTVWLNQYYRGTARANMHLGFGDSNFRSFDWSVEADQILFRENGVNGYVGLGLGTGSLSLGEDPKTLNAQQVFAKGQAGVMLREKKKAYDFALYAKMGLTPVETLNGNEAQSGLVYYPIVGFQASILFGDFVPPNKGKKGKKGKQGNKGNGGRR